MQTAGALLINRNYVGSHMEDGRVLCRSWSFSSKQTAWSHANIIYSGHQLASPSQPFVCGTTAKVSKCWLDMLQGRNKSHIGAMHMERRDRASGSGSHASVGSNISGFSTYGCRSHRVACTTAFENTVKTFFTASRRIPARLAEERKVYARCRSSCLWQNSNCSR